MSKEINKTLKGLNEKTIDILLYMVPGTEYRAQEITYALKFNWQNIARQRLETLVKRGFVYRIENPYWIRYKLTQEGLDALA